MDPCKFLSQAMEKLEEPGNGDPRHGRVLVDVVQCLGSPSSALVPFFGGRVPPLK